MEPAQSPPTIKSVEEEEGKSIVNSEINVSYPLYLNLNAYILFVASVSHAWRVDWLLATRAFGRFARVLT